MNTRWKREEDFRRSSPKDRESVIASYRFRAEHAAPEKQTYADGWVAHLESIHAELIGGK